MSLNETALACLNRNRLLYLNMLEVLRRGSAELLWAGEGGVLLYDRGSGAYMLTARDRAALDGMLPKKLHGTDLEKLLQDYHAI